jgi:hypothetical protein
LIQFAGKDLSWAFNDRGEPLERINQYGENVPLFPSALEKEDEQAEYWWRDESNIVGKVTCMERRVRIINALTRSIISMNVCEEDTIETIKRKYSKIFNRNADHYIWRKTGPTSENSGRLFMNKTLTQNGLMFAKNEQLGLPPALWLFYILNKD